MKREASMRIRSLTAWGAACMAACAVSAAAYVGDWTSYTNLSGIRDLRSYRGYLFAATSGGVRRVAANRSETVYRNVEGLRDVGIQALDTTENGELWASSEEGFLYRLNPSQKTWEVFGTAYKSMGWKMNKRAMLCRSGYAIVGSEKGLSFFSLSKHIAEANLDKMGADNGIAVNSVLMVEDTLFAGTNHGIFRATLHLDRLLTDPAANIFNPTLWNKIPGSDSVFFFHGNPPTDSAFSETLPADADPQKAHGLLRYVPGAGIRSQFDGAFFPEPAAMASRYGKLIIAGQEFANPSGLEAVVKIGGKWYVGGASGLFEYRPETSAFDILTNPLDLPLPTINFVKATPYGNFGWAPPKLYKQQGSTWRQVPGFEMLTDPLSMVRSGLHAFHILGPDEYYVGTWGFGFRISTPGDSRYFDALNSCIETTTPPSLNVNFPVILSQALYKNRGIWMSNLLVEDFKIAFYDFDTKQLQCFPVNSQALNPWNVQVVGDSVLVVVTEQGPQAFRIRENGAAVSLDPDDLLQGLANISDYGIAGKMDGFGNFWMTTDGQVAYVPAIQFNPSASQSFRILENFPGANCRNLELDSRGHLWAGCQSGGVFEITPGKDSLSHSFKKYGLNEGLLSENVYNLDVNPANGEVWAVSNKGISRYESGSRPVFSGLAGAKVYPNPFLAKHRYLIFDNLSPGSRIQVFTQGGSVVYHASLASDAGGQLRWDGRNQSGARVTEGVYFYAITSGGQLKNGKIIVAR